MRNTEIVEDVLVGVLNDMAMVFADPDRVDDRPTDYLAAEVRFTGPTSGRMTIAATPDVLRELAAGVLGVDADDAQAHEVIADALGEFTNVALGTLLPRLQGEAAVFDLGGPQPLTPDSALWSELMEDADTVMLTADDGVILARFKIED